MTAPDDGGGAAGLHDVQAAARFLREGGLVAFATETVYGLGADAEQAQAVQAIYRTKGRPADHPLIVHVIDAEQARWWALWSDRAERVAAAFWPGPLTLILPRRPDAPAWACAGQASIGLRCPSHPQARELLAAFSALGGHGIAAPSANRFGRISPTSADHVREDLAEEIARGDLRLLDGGASEVGLESTIVDLTRARPVLLRPGGVARSDLEQSLGEPVELSPNVIDPGTVDLDAPRASGTLAAHYAPVKPLTIVAGVPGDAGAPADAGARSDAGATAWAAELADAGHRGQRVAALVFDGQAPALAELAGRKGAELALVATLSADPAHYGRGLYDQLRRLDRSDADRLLLQAPPAGGPWQAIWDRLLRAATGSRGQGRHGFEPPGHV